jgi:hypothetical protein
MLKPKKTEVIMKAFKFSLEVALFLLYPAFVLLMVTIALLA